MSRPLIHCHRDQTEDEDEDDSSFRDLDIGSSLLSLRASFSDESNVDARSHSVLLSVV